MLDVKETMRVCNTKRTLLPCEHLSDVAFNVYRVVGVPWQSCSCFFFFFTPRMGLVVGTLRRRQTTE